MWLMILVLANAVMSAILMRSHAKRTGKNVRHAVLPYALLVAITAIIAARRLIGDDMLPWVDVVFLVPLVILLALLTGIYFVRSKRYLRDAWSMETKDDDPQSKTHANPAP